MNAWLALAGLLIVLWTQLALGTGENVALDACTSDKAGVAAAPTDFLFASAQEWKRLALEAELEPRH